jgi:hypothetical protein
MVRLVGTVRIVTGKNLNSEAGTLGGAKAEEGKRGAGAPGPFRGGDRASGFWCWVFHQVYFRTSSMVVAPL